MTISCHGTVVRMRETKKPVSGFGSQVTVQKKVEVKVQAEESIRNAKDSTERQALGIRPRV